MAASVAVYGTYVPQAAPAVDGALDWVDFQDNARFNASREACSAGACTSNPETGTYAIDEGTITFTDDDGTTHAEPFAVPVAADSGTLATVPERRRQLRLDDRAEVDGRGRDLLQQLGSCRGRYFSPTE